STMTGGTSLRLDAVDPDGTPVVSARSLIVRPVQQAALDGTQRGRQNALFRLDWAAVAAERSAAPLDLALLGAGRAHPDLAALEQALAEGAEAPQAVVATIDSPADAADPAEAARVTAVRALELVQRWLASERLGDARLVVATRGAVAVGEESPDVAQSPVWGLVHSAQSEHPGRFVLVDVDGSDGDGEPDWNAALATDEPQLAVRKGELLAPRLMRAETAAPGAGWSP
ncbi:hypothetical protein VM98_32940, partial [Streptomyces rubellomurinus subsp. indigoferus]